MKITKKQIKELAESSMNAKLKKWYPKVFDDKYLNEEELNKILRDTYSISVRSGSEYKEKSFYLTNFYNWEIKKDSFGILCLIPTKK